MHRTLDASRKGESGAPEGIRTPDPRFRRPVLYPAELPAPTSGPEPKSSPPQCQHPVAEHVYNRVLWRRERDSNPRWSYKPHTPLAGERLQPLGHLSTNSIVKGPVARSRSPEGASAPGCLFLSFSLYPGETGLARLAEEEGFEPPVGLPTAVFKTAAFDHSATPPQVGARGEANRSSRGSQGFSTPP